MTPERGDPDTLVAIRWDEAPADGPVVLASGNQWRPRSRADDMLELARRLLLDGERDNPVSPERLIRVVTEVVGWRHRGRRAQRRIGGRAVVTES